MRTAEYLKKVAEDQRAVDDFYNDRLKLIQRRIDDNKEKVMKLKEEEEKMIKKIEKLRKDIEDIKNNESNHYDNNLEFRLKNFGLERKIFNKENEIQKLEKELEWKRKMNEIEIQFLKDKNDSYVNDYEKLYNEKAEIDNAIIKDVLKAKITDVGEVMTANELKNENDQIFENLRKEN